MSVAAPTHGNTRRRGHREMTTQPLLILLALTAYLAGTVFCQDDEESGLHEMHTEISEKQDPTNLITTPEPDASVHDPSGVQFNKVKDTDVSDEGQSNITSTEDTNGTSFEESEEQLSPVLILVPVVLVLVIIVMIVCGFMINRRWNQIEDKSTDNDQYHEDKYLHGNSTEKVPIMTNMKEIVTESFRPMFEEDVPSVLELEMEDLEQWMNKDGGDQMDSGQGI